MENIVSLQKVYKPYVSETYLSMVRDIGSLPELSNIVQVEKCPSELHRILHNISARYLAGSASLRGFRSVSIKRLLVQEALDKTVDSDAYLLAELKTTYLAEYERLIKLPRLSIDDLNVANMKLAKGKKGVGSLRTNNVHIGTSDKLATYRAPSSEKVSALMNDLIDFINDPSKDSLTKAYVAHIQFSLIHPYVDGNGRVARLLWDVLVNRCTNRPLNPSVYRLNHNRNSSYREALEVFPSDPESFFDKEFWQQSHVWSNEKIQAISYEFKELKGVMLPYRVLNLLDPKAKQLMQKALYQPILQFNEESCPAYLDKLIKQGFYKRKMVKNGKGGEVLECEFVVGFYIKIEELLFN